MIVPIEDLDADQLDWLNVSHSTAYVMRAAVFGAPDHNGDWPTEYFARFLCDVCLADATHYDQSQDQLLCGDCADYRGERSTL